MSRTLSEQEFNTIRAHVLEHAPAGLSREDFERSVTPVLDGAIAEAEHSPTPVTGSSLGRFAAGAWAMVNPVSIAQGVYGAVRHPVATLTNIGTAAVEQGRQAADLARQGRYGEAVGHGAAAALPILGPAAANAGERMAAGDVAGGLGEGAGLLAGIEAPRAAAAVMGGMRRMPGLATRLEEGAATRVADVMSPKVGANKVRFGNRAADIAPQLAADLAEDGAPFTRSGFHAHVQSKLAGAEQMLDATSDARLSARTFPTRPLIDALLEKRKALTASAVEGSMGGGKSAGTVVANSGAAREIRPPVTAIGADVVPSPNATRVAVIDRAIAELKQLGPVTRYDPIRTLRHAYDGQAKVIYSPAVTSDYLTARGGALGAADVTGTLREALAKWDPETAKANGQYSLYRTADDVLKATAEVERTRPKVGRQIIARMAGTVLGEKAAGVPGAVAGYVAGPLVDSALSSGATTQLKTAALMQKLATAIRKGDLGLVQSVTHQLKRLGTTSAAVVGNATSPSGPQATTAPALP